MNSLQTRIYLASQSPRRRELLRQIGINFDLLLLRNSPQRPADVDETPLPDEDPLLYVQRVCRAKATFGWKAVRMRKLHPFPVLAADTTVTLDNRILGKPRDEADAVSLLRELSGRQHQVHSAVAIACEEKVKMRLSTTEVTFASLDEERIRRHLNTNEWNDKAGAYGIQGHAAAFIARIEGSYSGVMGLPLFETVELLRDFGQPAP